MFKRLVSLSSYTFFAADIDAFLDVIFKEPFDNDFSWPAIGGIHGMPYVRWGDSGPDSSLGGDTFGGYCTHGSVLFPTWHRPYTALFEVSSQNVVLYSVRRSLISPSSNQCMPRR